MFAPFARPFFKTFNKKAYTMLGDNALLPPIYMRKRIVFRAASSTYVPPLAKEEKKIEKKAFSGSTLMRPIGLLNLGNTCFLNSVLQCLMHVPEFLEITLSSCTCSELKKRPLWCISCEMQRLMQRALTHTSSISPTVKGRISPSGLVCNIQKISKSFRYGRQEDAHEFLCVLLDALEKQTASLKSLTAGSFSSIITCKKCGNISTSKEPFGNISLQVSTNLEQSLQRFIRSECLDEYYKCSSCLSSGTCVRRLLISDIPSLLIFHMKRFSPGFASSKITKHMEFPEVLDMNPFLAEATSGSSYALAGIVVHSGYSTSSGHYHACVRNQGLWYEIDDEDVRLLKNTTVHSQQAYLLFYVPQSSLISARPKEPLLASKATPPHQVEEQLEQKQQTKSDRLSLALGQKRPLDSDAIVNNTHASKNNSDGYEKNQTCAVINADNGINIDTPLDPYDAAYDAGRMPKKGKKKRYLDNSFGLNVSKAASHRIPIRRHTHKLRHSNSTWHTGAIASK